MKIKPRHCQKAREPSSDQTNLLSLDFLSDSREESPMVALTFQSYYDSCAAQWHTTKLHAVISEIETASRFPIWSWKCHQDANNDANLGKETLFILFSPHHKWKAFRFRKDIPFLSPSLIMTNRIMRFTSWIMGTKIPVRYEFYERAFPSKLIEFINRWTNGYRFISWSDWWPKRNRFILYVASTFQMGR